MSMVVSGEGVVLQLDHAGAGSRTVAAIIDYILQIIAVIVFLVIDVAALGGDSAASAAAIITELVLIAAGYPILMEWLTRGRTLGKLALGLRVVRDDGGPIAFRQALVRGLSSLLLEKPGLLGPLGIAAGLITITVSPENKRIGDYMAGTFVIRERVANRATLTAPIFSVPYYLQPWAMALDLTQLDDNLALGIRQFVMRANQMTPAARDQLGAQFVAHVLAVTSPPPPYGTPIPAILTTVLAERRRRADLRGW
jgi:uncharacterized RDD family membrane protein YckC